MRSSAQIDRPQLSGAYLPGINEKGTHPSLVSQLHITSVGTRVHVRSLEKEALKYLPKTCALPNFKLITDAQLEAMIPDYSFSMIAIENCDGKPAVFILHDCDDDPKANYRIFMKAVDLKFGKSTYNKNWEAPCFEGKKAGWLWKNPPWYSSKKQILRYMEAAPPQGLGMKKSAAPIVWQAPVSIQ